MAQSSQHFCPNCGAPLAPGQRFCSNCGSTLEVGAGDPTARASEPGQGYSASSGPPEDATQLPVPPPPPPTDSFSQQPNTYYPPQSAPSAAPLPQQAAPEYAKPQKNSSRGVLGQIGCGVLAIILVILLICGGVGYFVYRAVSNAANSTNATATAQNYTSTTGNGSQNSGSGSPAAIPTVIAQINQTVIYASVNTTIVSVQEATSFSDDTSTNNAAVVLRINVKEDNASESTAFLNYNTNYLLVLPDKSTVAVSNSQVSGVINQSVQRNNWLDFPLTKSIPINQLTLRIGASTEAQINVPLTGNADLSSYQNKTIAPNTTIQYNGLKWKLTQVTSSLSHKATQAKTGMRFITLAFTIDNPTSNTVFTSANTYARLQQGSITNSETDDTLPVDLAPGTTGSTGTITFEMPQPGTSFTFILLAQPNTTPAVSQQSLSFQI